MLAILAASGDRGISRDQLIGLLWSEGTSEAGRHSLEQLLHALRRSLGESLFDGTNPLSLNPGAMASDVGEFHSALASGTLADAVALYSGPFLHGFYLDDAPEFERWATSERSRIAERYAEALGKLATDAEKSGDHSVAIQWRRRLVEADPVSSRYALSLMRSLVASGDRTAALQHARIYESLVRQELDSEPDPSITSYAAALRTGVVDVPESMSKLVVTAALEAPQTLSAAPLVPQAGSLAPPSETSRTSRDRSRIWWISGTVIAVALLLVAAFFVKMRTATPRVEANRIVVLPFRITETDSSVQYLGEGAADLIAPMLNGEGGPIAVDSRSAISTWKRITRGREGTASDARAVAKELGASLALSGAIVESAGRLTITGSVLSVDGADARALTSVSGPTDSVQKLIDDFVAQLLVRQSGLAETSVAAVISHSLPAIRAYLDGRAEHRRADEDRAIESFARALDIDSTFALAALDLAVSTGKLLRTKICRLKTCRVYSMVPGFVSSERNDDLFDRSIRLAWENRSKLGGRDLPLLQAMRGNSYPRESSARETLVNLSKAVRSGPDRPEAHYLLGTLLLYQGSALGLSSSGLDAESAFRTASKLDSSYVAPLAGLVDVAAFAGDTANLRRAGAEYLSRDVNGPTADYVRWLLAAGTGDVATLGRVRARFRSMNRLTLDHIYLTSQMSGIGLEDADSVAKILEEILTDPLEKSVAFRRGQLLALNRGRPAEAARLLRRMDELRSSGSRYREFFAAAAMFGDGDHAAGDSSVRALEISLAGDTIPPMTADVVRKTSITLSLLSLWYLAAGDTAHAAAAAGWLQRHAQGQSRNRVLLLLPQMLIASRARKPEGAQLRAFVDTVTLDGCCELPEYALIVLAQAYEASGDEAAALRVIRRGVWYYPPRSLSALLREEGRLSARRGERAAAIRAYDHYLALRSNPEPSRVAERDRILAEVNRLKGLR